MKEPVVTLQLALDHGLKEDEFQRACDILGRLPSLTELGIFSAMWSEHCSYKSSRVHLRKLPTKGPRVFIGPGENAGAVELGDGLCAVFKMESHNHPSFIEPYQGAATGVGGILRDVFTMGAYPIANLNALRFGSPDKAHMAYLIRGVTKGIGNYGNCVGVPTVGGEVFFDPAYQGNIIVNAMTVGLAHKDQIFLGEASGPGNHVVYVGAKTGRDGIHGASMASEEFSEASESKRPTVQVGDPFTEKLLLEALMELFPTGAIVGIQDMGAAGLTSSSFEMASRAGSGLELHLKDVPTREVGMSAYEIMLSESQERMLLVCEPKNFAAIQKVFHKWDLEAAVIGTVTESGRVHIYAPDGTLAVDMPVGPLSDQAPVYDRPCSEPAQFAASRCFDLFPYKELAANQANDALKQLLQSPNIASKRWIYNQYDQSVQTNTMLGPGEAEAALVRIKGTRAALAITTDCNPRLVHLDPSLGTIHAVAEAARNISCVGALPLALTDCLNFASPENPEVMWQFRESLDGMAEAAIALETPIISGNVSFYNETNGKPIFPTPALGMVGLLENRQHFATNHFEEAGLKVYLLGVNRDELGGSEYLAHRFGVTNGAIPELHLKFEKQLQSTLRELIAKGIVRHARDCSLGGLAVALAKCCFGSHKLGLEVELLDELPLASLLFGESASRVVVAVAEKRASELEAAAASAKIPAQSLGTTGGNTFKILHKGQELINLSVSELADLHDLTLDHILG